MSSVTDREIVVRCVYINLYAAYVLHGSRFEILLVARDVVQRAPVGDSVYSHGFGTIVRSEGLRKEHRTIYKRFKNVNDAAAGEL